MSVVALLPFDNDDHGICVVEATGAADVEAFRTVVCEHAAALAAGLPRAAIDAILADAAMLPGRYAPPRGSIVLAWAALDRESLVPERIAVGGGALHALNADVAEIKRMFVQPSYRRAGVGGRILTALIEAARARGYRRVRLGTRPEMHTAVLLYGRYGFTPIEPYRVHELSPDTLFFEREVS
ncbi:MAG: N-acetyltransferase [Gemmatimonadaceae bacterium]